jgi:hypothetical protein
LIGVGKLRRLDRFQFDNRCTMRRLDPSNAHSPGVMHRRGPSHPAG